MPKEIPAEVRTARRNVSRLVKERNSLLREAAQTGVIDYGRLDEIDVNIGGLLDDVVALVDPCDASETEPLVLLPVRLETRFQASGRRTKLRVRIYPDEIHVDDLARGLTEDEVKAGRAYWTSVWADPVPETAWGNLVAASGADRAEWVAYVCTPTNLVERASAATPVFPRPEARGPRNIIARALPDRFVVLAIQGGRVSQAVGRPVPRDLSLSPIPLDGDVPPRVADALNAPPGSEWLVDYDRAVEIGMAVTVTLASGVAPVERVIALGTRASLSAEAGADELEDLLTGHRFGAGLELLAQGAPTNNGDGERSPYRSRRAPQAPPLLPAAPVPGSDTFAAATVLGVDASLLTQHLGDGHEQTLARHVNTALWAPGWGEYLSRLDDQGVPGVVDAQREWARRLFRDHVRGRGCAPTIRVGAQPYGLLPVSDLRSWVPQAGETTAGILQVVLRLIGRWKFAAERSVPRVRTGSAGLDATILEILGSSPVMQGLRVRPGLSDEVSDAVIASLGLDQKVYQAEKTVVAGVTADLIGAAAAKMTLGSLHRQTRPLPLPLASQRDAEFIDALLGTPSKVLPVDSVLQALLALAWDSGELDVAKAAPASMLPSLIDFVDLDTRLRAQTAATVARADSATPEELFGMVDQLEKVGISAGGPAMLRAHQPVEQIQTSLAEVALSAPPTAQAKSVGAAALAAWLLAMGYRSEVRNAIQALTGTELAERELAVAEALDCSSHRLDAWATAIVAERRALQVRGQMSGNGRGARGLTIGAYGVVEDLRPQTGPTMNGWIHSPSTQHAVAAGMLRSSHLSHLPRTGPVTEGGPFALDLSSGRIGSATHVIDGVRQGQQLGALVGYQIERALAEAGLARLQLSLRTIAPLVARRLHDSDGADSLAAQEAVAANNVVDAVLLLKKHRPDDPALRTALAKIPQNVYLDPGDWKSLSNNEWTVVVGIMRKAADTIDAVADVMLAESVLQVAGGNPHRAAAAMDAMSTGASPSDTMEILETHDGAERLTHRVLAVVGDRLPPSRWNPNRPRALAEPRLEAWAAAHLGDPVDIVLAEAASRRITMAEAGMAALDLVHATEFASLERSLRAAVPDLTDLTLAVTRDPSWPRPARALGQVVRLAITLRAMIAGSRPLVPADLARPGEQATRNLDGALPELVARVTDLVASLGAVVAELEGPVATIPESGIVADEDTAAALVRAAHRLEPFGIALEPTSDLPLEVSWVRAAWQAAQAHFTAAQQGLVRVAALPAGTPAGLVLEAAQEAVSAVLGGGFLVVPLLEAGPVTDGFVESLISPGFVSPPPTTVRQFVRDVSTVRQQVTRLSEALLLGSALGHPRSLTVAQLTERDAAGPAPGTTHWLAGPLPPNGPWPASPAAHLVMDQVGSVGPETAVAGLALDGWVEDLPEQVGPRADDDDPRPGRARTGLAVRCNSASARPPQAVLCAVSPDGERWTTDALRSVIEHTLDLARIRMVTLERLAGEGLVLPALYTRSSSLQGRPHVDFKNLAALRSTDLPMPFVKEVKQ